MYDALLPKQDDVRILGNNRAIDFLQPERRHFERW